jgi:hypothetical protein
MIFNANSNEDVINDKWYVDFWMMRVIEMRL